MPVHYQIVGRGAAEIAASVEQGVVNGEYPAGASLPPVRRLAAELGVAPATVAAAYQSLRQRGVVETAGRNGTRVRHRPPVARRGTPRVPLPPGVVDLATGEPNPAMLPPLGPRLRRLASVVADPISYRGSGPLPELVALARERLSADGVHATAVTVTSGALDAIERLLSAHLRPGDRVGIEDPAWANLIDLVAALGLQAVGVPVDDEGPTVDGLRHALDLGISALVITSRAQNPTGACVSRTRAPKLRALLGAVPDVLVIEDDHAGELAEVPLAPVATASGRWAFVRSVSKPYGPDLRLAVVAGDEGTIARVEGRMRLGAGWVSTLLQRLVVEMWTDEAVAAVVGRARDEYRRRREALLAALAAHDVPARGRSGINVWVPVTDEAGVLGALRDAGWAVAPGSLYRLSTPPGIRISIPSLELSDVDRLASAVAAAVTARDPGAYR